MAAGPATCGRERQLMWGISAAPPQARQRLVAVGRAWAVLCGTWRRRRSSAILQEPAGYADELV
ncbi:hypothetical protein H8F26_08475 [Synechococcus sp. CBW1006]|nr:hypothetical protein H8F26_08475 [Synechococcus sp. CBW1006]